VREGKVKRILSRNHFEVDQGWICDKGRFAFTHLRAGDRLVDPIKRIRLRGFEPVSWDEAVDTAEQLLRAAHGRVVVALSGSETVEQAYALAKLVRVGLDSHEAMLPEEVSPALDAYRAPLSSIGDADVVVVLGDVPLQQSAPIVDLWVRAARRNGARVVTELEEQAVRDAQRPVLIWSGPGGRGGATVAADAERLGVQSAFYVPATPNGRGAADAWAACCDDEPADLESVGLLIVSGDEAANDPNVRALAEKAESVTYVNLEGRLQRLRRSAIPPAPDELAWLSQLASRFGVELAPHAPMVFAELSERIYGGLPFGEVGERAPLRTYDGAPAHVEAPPLPEPEVKGEGLRLVSYKPLFSGPAVERVEELQFQRPAPEVELARDDAQARGIANGQTVTVSHNGTSVQLRARVVKDLRAGVVRIAREHAGDLTGLVEVRA
jgi:predicted molibdopterin-dependent oxidoreductase YjgC